MRISIRPPSSPIPLAIVLTAILAPSAGAQLYQYKEPRRDPRIRTAGPLAPSSSIPMVPPGHSALDTQINLDIFTGKEGVGFHAQSWEPLFERAGVTAQIRPGVGSDKLSIYEKRYGKLRQVFLTGKLDRNGTLTFPGRSFTLAESAAFEEWIRELKTYGAEGNPTGKPLWGLSKQQFDNLFQSLRAPVEREVAELPFDDAVRGLRLPARYPFRLSVAAERALAFR